MNIYEQRARASWYRQWLNYSKVGGGMLHFLHSLPSPLFLPLFSLLSLLFPYLSLPSLLLEVGPLKSS